MTRTRRITSPGPVPHLARSITTDALFLAVSLAALAGLTGGCSGPQLVVNGIRPAALGEIVSGTDEITVHQINLRWSNAYVVRSPRGAILVDAGSPSDRKRLPAALAKLGLREKDLKLVVLTHVHGDHAGLAAQLQRAGVKVAVGRGDEATAKQGHNPPLRPQTTTAKLIRPIVDFPFPKFTPDRVIERELDLEPFGLGGCHVEPFAGHTPGSLVVFIGSTIAFTGDMFLGGYLGGALLSGQAGEHYYQDDAAQNRRNIKTLLDRGVRRFLLGHGGPVEATSVREAFSPAKEAPAPGSPPPAPKEAAKEE